MRNGFVLFEVVKNSSTDIVDFRFLNANPGFEALTGIKNQISIGKTLKELFNDSTINWHKSFITAIESTQFSLFEVYNPITQSHFEVSSFYFGRSILACIFSDITNRKNAETILNETLVETERMNRLMVGREERIIELKQMINKLLIETGKSPEFKNY